MKKSVLVMILVFGIFANVGRVWTALTEPANCALNLGKSIAVQSIDFVRCVYGNLTFTA